MEPILIVTLVCAVLLVLEPNLPHAVDLAVQWLYSEYQRHTLQTRLFLRLKYDRLTFGNSPLARLLRAVELWRIMHNPAYREFFNRDEV